jgi:hypothetical protein
MPWLSSWRHQRHARGSMGAARMIEITSAASPPSFTTVQ